MFYCFRPLTLPSFEVVLDRGEGGSFLNIYELQTLLQKGGAIQPRLWSKPPPQKKQIKQMAPKVIFQMATVKGVFVSSKICSNRHLTKGSKGKGKWKERLKEKVRNVPSRRRGFSGEQQKMYFGEKNSFWRLLICCFTRRPWHSVRALVLFPIASLSV